MDEGDPRRQLDKFSGALVDFLRTELEITMKRLVSADKEIALAQVDSLSKRAIRRLKTSEFDFWGDIGRVSPTDLPEEEVLKAIQITIAALDETYNEVREQIIERDEAMFGDDGEPDLAE